MAILGFWKSSRIPSSAAKKKKAPMPCLSPAWTQEAAVAGEVRRIDWVAVGSGES